MSSGAKGKSYGNHAIPLDIPSQLPKRILTPQNQRFFPIVLISLHSTIQIHPQEELHHCCWIKRICIQINNKL